MKNKVIGITGGLATGKTTMADMFAAKGGVKIDADEIAHHILEKDDSVKGKVVELFGDDILEGGEVDRRKLAGKVFFSREKLDVLCRIMHPAIIQAIKERTKKFADRTVIVDAPLLIEAGLHEYVDIVIVVVSTEDVQIKRAMDRGITEEEARRIMNSQMSLSEKEKFADYIIDNETDLNEIKEGVEKIWSSL